jgi:hypothetical protein
MVQRAEAALDELQGLQEPISEENALPEAFTIHGYRASCTLLAELLSPAAGYTSPQTELCKETVEALEVSPGNPAGLEKATLALRFALAGVEEAVDRLEDLGGGPWEVPLAAAYSILEGMQVSLDCSINKASTRMKGGTDV